METVDMSDGLYRSKPSLLDSIFNFLTTLVLLTTIFLGGIFAAIYFDPQIFFNPFPPTDPVNPPPPSAPTNTEVFVPPPPTQTPTSAPSPSPTATQPMASPSPTPLPLSKQQGTPAFTQNFMNDLACEWAGIAGQVLPSADQSGADPWIHLVGEYDGVPLDFISLPGSAPGYGAGGYEFTLGNRPVASEGLIWIQLEDPLGNPMAEKVSITTSGECSENLIMVNWVLIQ